MTDTSPETPAVDPALTQSRKAARKRWLVRLAVILAVIGLAWGVWYVLVARNFVSTDNAYVNAQSAQVTPLVAGSATEVLVRDTQQVKAGDVLVRLDQADAKIALAQAEADLAAARRRFRQTVANSSALAAQVDGSGAGLTQAQARYRTAQAEHDKFVRVLHGQGADVLLLQELLATALKNPEARGYAMRHTFDRRSYGVGLAAALIEYAEDLNAQDLAELLIGGLTK